MLYIHVIIGILAAIHAFAYGRWLMNNNNRWGGSIVYLIVLCCLVLPIYRLVITP
ncbi:MAG: hypothetical protein H6Q73_2377 [Firmicutes bacterium]|nr:hypothetical protein [Bacillota bacterium]